MPEYTFPPEFETQVREAMDVPEPDAQAMDVLRAQFIARGMAALKADLQPDSALDPFRPEKETNKMKRTKFFSVPRLAWGVVLLVIASLVALAFSSPEVVNALQRLFGYIPGVGVVEQTPPIRALAEPVVIERDGVTLTVEFAISTIEKTTIIYRHVGPPVNLENYPPPQALFEDNPLLRLPDETSLDIISARRQPAENSGNVYALDFPPLPEGIDKVTLELSNLAGLPPGLGPENWEIPIRFVVTDGEHVIFPVVEYEPTPAIQPSAESLSQMTPAFNASITLDRYAELPDGYILMGNFQWTDTSIPQYGMMLGIPVITDTAGRQIEYEFADVDTYPKPEELRQYWAYKIPTKDFVLPLKLEFYVQKREQANAVFQFEPGSNPQNGQAWDLNLEVPVNGRILKVISVTHYEPIPDIHNFDFVMSSDSDIVGAMVIEANHPPMGGGGGGGIPQENASFTSGISLEGNIPNGPLTILVTSLEVLLPGDWTITWNPPAVSTP